MATYDYITLASKKLDCTRYQPDYSQTHKVIHETLNAKTHQNIGMHVEAWDVTVEVYNGTPVTGYASLDDLIGWLKAESVASGAELAFVGMLGESGTVYIAGGGQPRPRGILAGWWECELRLVKKQ